MCLISSDGKKMIRSKFGLDELKESLPSIFGTGSWRISANILSIPGETNTFFPLSISILMICKQANLTVCPWVPSSHIIFFYACISKTLLTLSFFSFFILYAIDVASAIFSHILIILGLSRWALYSSLASSMAS